MFNVLKSTQLTAAIDALEADTVLAVVAKAPWKP
jgi:hypothetical protein